MSKQVNESLFSGGRFKVNICFCFVQSRILESSILGTSDSMAKNSTKLSKKTLLNVLRKTTDFGTLVTHLVSSGTS